MHDSSTCQICHGLPVDGRMTDEEFFEFLSACRDELADKQVRFQERIAGPGRWFYDLRDNLLTIGSEQFSVTAVGTYSSEYETWLWAWANEDFPEMAREASRQLQSLHDVTGFRVFLDSGIPASSEDAQDFAALAVHHLGAIGFFRDGSDSPILYLAVHEREGGI